MSEPTYNWNLIYQLPPDLLMILIRGFTANPNKTPKKFRDCLLFSDDVVTEWKWNTDAIRKLSRDEKCELISYMYSDRFLKGKKGKPVEY